MMYGHSTQPAVHAIGTKITTTVLVATSAVANVLNVTTNNAYNVETTKTAENHKHKRTAEYWTAGPRWENANVNTIPQASSAPVVELMVVPVAPFNPTSAYNAVQRPLLVVENHPYSAHQQHVVLSLATR